MSLSQTTAGIELSSIIDITMVGSPPVATCHDKVPSLGR